MVRSTTFTDTPFVRCARCDGDGALWADGCCACEWLDCPNCNGTGIDVGE
jgi:hypothetical protein